MKKLFIASAVIILLSCCSDADREKDKALWFSHGKHDGKNILWEQRY